MVYGLGKSKMVVTGVIVGLWMIIIGFIHLIVIRDDEENCVIIILCIVSGIIIVSIACAFI